MAVRTPGAWTVAAVATVAGGVAGIGSAGLRSALAPWQIGESVPVAHAVSPDAPRAEPLETAHAFGTLGTGMTGSHRFEIRNTGGGPLVLSRGTGSCSCTLSDLGDATEGGSAGGRRIVAPGASTFVTVTWQGKPPGGSFRQYVTILTDDPRRPEIVLTVEGMVVPTWRAVPDAIVLPQLATSTGGRASATIYTFGDEPPTVRDSGIDGPDAARFFSLATVPLSAAEIAAETGATGGFRVGVDVKPGLPIGLLKRTISVTFTMPDEVRAELPLEAAVGGDLVLAGPGWDSSRQALLLGTVSGRSGLTRRIFLTAKGPHREQVRPTVVETVPDSLQVTVGPGSPVGTGGVMRFPIDLVIPPGSRGANHLCSAQAPAGRIVLATGHPESPSLSIPICVAIGP